MAELVVPFGENPEGRIVLVDEVPRGLACNCVCPGCRKPLVARNGKDITVAHHFAHAAAEGGCGGAPETSLHRYAKQVLAEGRWVGLPPLIAAYKNHRNEFAPATDFHADEVELERRIGDFQPDAIMTRGGERVAIEVLVTHRVDAEKTRKIRAAELPAIEIDLTYLHRDFDPIEVAERVQSKAFRTWLFHPRLGPECAALQARIEAAAERHQRAAELARSEGRRAEMERQAAALRSAWGGTAALPAAPRSLPSWHELPRPTSPQPERPWSPEQLAGLRRAAAMRPSSWLGATAYPSPDAFCGRCQGLRFWRDGGVWRCAGCFPEAVANA